MGFALGPLLPAFIPALAEPGADFAIVTIPVCTDPGPAPYSMRRRGTICSFFFKNFHTGSHTCTKDTCNCLQWLFCVWLVWDPLSRLCHRVGGCLAHRTIACCVSHCGRLVGLDIRQKSSADTTLVRQLTRRGTPIVTSLGSLTGVRQLNFLRTNKKNCRACWR